MSETWPDGSVLPLGAGCLLSLTEPDLIPASFTTGVTKVTVCTVSHCDGSGMHSPACGNGAYKIFLGTN